MILPIVAATVGADAPALQPSSPTSADLFKAIEMAYQPRQVYRSTAHQFSQPAADPERLFDCENPPVATEPLPLDVVISPDGSIFSERVHPRWKKVHGSANRWMLCAEGSYHERSPIGQPPAAVLSASTMGDWVEGNLGLAPSGGWYVGRFGGARDGAVATLVGAEIVVNWTPGLTIWFDADDKRLLRTHSEAGSLIISSEVRCWISTPLFNAPAATVIVSDIRQQDKPPNRGLTVLEPPQAINIPPSHFDPRTHFASATDYVTGAVVFQTAGLAPAVPPAPPTSTAGGSLVYNQKVTIDGVVRTMPRKAGWVAPLRWCGLALALVALTALLTQRLRRRPARDTD